MATSKSSSCCSGGGRTLTLPMSVRNLSVLHMAVTGEEKATLEQLLSWPKPANTEVRDDRGDTPLHYAVLQGNKELTETLLRHGADPNAPGEGSVMPLENAVREQRSMVPLLMKYGADAARKRPDGLFVLMIAAYKDDSELVEQLMRNQKSIKPLVDALETIGIGARDIKWDDAGKALPWAILHGKEVITWMILHYGSLSANTTLPPSDFNMLVIATHY